MNARFFEIVNEGNFVVLDTETTGLERGEICQIAIINSSAEVLLDTLVKPVNPIPFNATQIHGITDEMVQDAPGFVDLLAQLRTILNQTNVIVYNAVYDRKMLHQSAEAAAIDRTDWKLLSDWWCAMEAFAQIYGDWNSYRHSYRWQKLTTAARYYRIPVNNAHSALGDCLMTLEVCKRMAQSYKSDPTEGFVDDWIK